MSMHDHAEHDSQRQGNFFTSRAGLVLLGFLLIGGVLLFTEHRLMSWALLSGFRCSCAR